MARKSIRPGLSTAASTPHSFAAALTIVAVAPEKEASYITIIDSILATSDLNTVSEKRIRKELEAAVQDDLTTQKSLIKELIMTRFDKFHAEKSAAPSSADESPARPVVNGHQPEPKSTAKPTAASVPSAPAMKSAIKTEPGPTKLVVTSPLAKSSKNKRKSDVLDEDARLAAMLQAEENGRARTTRASHTKNLVVTKKRKVSSKANSSVKIDDDSGIETESGETKKRNIKQTGGFHKPLTLSAPLAALLGETSLSRPETVKRLWAYFRENELQDPKDRRQIRCDDALKAIFRQDRVHMFTMNKLLSAHLFAPDE
ncbi:MAG: hypothetical protein M1826_006205 [Phylliscum demangeonii]|nr:MAG: hypothetical protein M1826_006205 [Phylliscum demangeonii]